MKTIVVGGKNVELHAVKGLVLSTSKNMETKVTGSGGGGFSYRGTGGNSNVRIKSNTTIHDQLFLLDDSGREHAFQLQDFNLACREGNNLAVVSAIKQGKDSGPYIAVVNHTTGKISFNADALKKAFAPNLLMLAAIFIGTCILGLSLAGSGFLVFAFFLFIGLFIYMSVVTSNNVKTVKSNINLADF